VLINSMHALAPSSASQKAGSRPAEGGQTQHLGGMQPGIGPCTLDTALPNSSEGPERVDNMPSSVGLPALSIMPADFHAQHFTKSSEKSEGRAQAKDVWMWFWPVKLKESPTPLGLDEPILAARPKSSAIACRLCSLDGTWKP